MVQARFMAPPIASSHVIFQEVIMKRFIAITTALTLLAGMGTAFAQPGRDYRRDDRRPDPPPMAMHGSDMHRPMHPDWRKGGHIARNDWGRGVHVDYRAHHLRTPPRGYEWREVDGNYVLAAVATGLIASIILSNH
jgi:Ni/Co efflux regulator RcnB